MPDNLSDYKFEIVWQPKNVLCLHVVLIIHGDYTRPLLSKHDRHCTRRQHAPTHPPTCPKRAPNMPQRAPNALSTRPRASPTRINTPQHAPTHANTHQTHPNAHQRTPNAPPTRHQRSATRHNAHTMHRQRGPTHTRCASNAPHSSK